MERIALYLEKLGYIIEEHGSIVRYLILIKNGIPIGFILPDFSTSLVNKDDENEVADVISFVKENNNLQLVSGSEYLVATHMLHQLTTYYDTKDNVVKYVCYIVSENGEVSNHHFDDRTQAIVNFITQSNMLEISKLRGKETGLKDAVLNKLIAFLTSKKNYMK